jgi:hypothetical protein
MADSGSPDYYREKALAVREMIAKLTNLALIDGLRQIAEDWDKLAEAAEQPHGTT